MGLCRHQKCENWFWWSDVALNSWSMTLKLGRSSVHIYMYKISKFDHLNLSVHLSIKSPKSSIDCLITCEPLSLKCWNSRIILIYNLSNWWVPTQVIWLSVMSKVGAVWAQSIGVSRSLLLWAVQPHWLPNPGFWHVLAQFCHNQPPIYKAQYVDSYI